MEKKIFEMCGLGVRLLLRCWTGNEKIWGDNLLDIVEFGQSCGLNYIDRNKFNMTIESFTCDMAEDFMKNMAETVSSIERKDALLLQIQSDIKNVAIIMGPEGDFTSEEVSVLKDKGFTAVNFSDNVLRSETACIFFVSVLSMFQ